MPLEASSEKKMVLITGASAGFGKACAEHLSQRSFQVYGTSRSACFDADSLSTTQKQPSFISIPCPAVPGWKNAPPLGGEIEGRVTGQGF